MKARRPGERDEQMIDKLHKLVSRLSSKVKCLFLDLLVSPNQSEILEMILTIIDFLDVIISEFG